MCVVQVTGREILTYATILKRLIRASLKNKNRVLYIVISFGKRNFICCNIEHEITYH